MSLELNVSYPETQQMPDPDLLREAIRRGQPLAGVMPTDDLLRRFIRAVRYICNPSHVWVYLLDAVGKPVLRVVSEVNGEVQVIGEEAATEPFTRPFPRTPFRDVYDDRLVLHIPIHYKGTMLGALRIVPRMDDDDELEAISPALELLSSFAACGLVNLKSAAVIHEQVMQQDALSKVISQTRLTAMNELAAAVAHQLNNPLTTIIADAEILMLRTDKDTSAYHTLEAIVRSGRRAAEVMRRLMASARPNKLEGVPHPVQVSQSIEDVLQLIRRYIRIENVTIERHFDEDVPLIWVAPEALEDVWLNLLTNARDALIGVADARIGIEVHYEAEADEIRVVIWDNGKGISEQELEIIFEPFFTTKPPVERLGLGLHISKQVVEGLGGTITASQRDEGGTRFEVCLPVRKEE